MYVEQFVMAYKVDQDRIRAILPDGYISLRPVMRINAEIRQSGNGEIVYVELNTPVEAEGRRGWLNIGHWDSNDSDISFTRNDRTVTVSSSFLMLTYTGTEITGGCPAEKDNDGCFYISADETVFVPAREIKENKEFCDCEFAWLFSEDDAKGRSIGKTLPAFREKSENTYEKKAFTPENAAALSCQQVLGAYIVRFES
ncbi:MAG: hypothetical protein Q4C46_12450 [Bacillota bacterium]|nr:hypothetical protein [Bacillota bacterium]